MRIKIPFDKNKDLEINIPEKNLIRIIKPKDFPLPDKREEIRRAVKNPVQALDENLKKTKTPK